MEPAARAVIRWSPSFTFSMKRQRVVTDVAKSIVTYSSADVRATVLREVRDYLARFERGGADRLALETETLFGIAEA
jgi:hypothetical protein